MLVQTRAVAGQYIRIDPGLAHSPIGIAQPHEAVEALSLNAVTELGTPAWIEVRLRRVTGWMFGLHLKPYAPDAGSAIGFHIIRVEPGMKEGIIRSRPRLIKAIPDGNGDLLAELHRALGDATTFIARPMSLGDQFVPFLAGRDPKVAAQDWVNRLEGWIRAAPFAYWESFNEMSDLSYMAAYGVFEAERVRLLASRGWKACVGNFGVGNPSDSAWPAFYPALEAGHTHRALLGLHEYGGLRLDTYYGPNQGPQMLSGQRVPFPDSYEEGYLFGRYRTVWRTHIVPRGWTNVRIALTEFGVDYVATDTIARLVGYPTSHWRSCSEAWARLDNRPDTARYYADQLIWADGQLRRDAYMEGVTIFTLGSYDDPSPASWRQYDIYGEVADMLYTHISNSRGD